MESRYLDNPIHPVMLNKASKSTNNGIAVGEVSTINQKNRKENAEREAPFLETHPVQIHSSDDNYTVMSPIGTLAHSLQAGRGIPEHFDPEAANKKGFE